MAVPSILPITIRVRLVNDSPHHVSLLQAYQSYCQRNKMPEDAPMVYMWESVRDKLKAATEASRLQLNPSATEGTYTHILICHTTIHTYQHIPSMIANTECLYAYTQFVQISLLMALSVHVPVLIHNDDDDDDVHITDMQSCHTAPTPTPFDDPVNVLERSFIQQGYQHLCSVIPHDLLLNVVTSAMPDLHCFYLFRRRFAQQLGMTSFLSYIFFGVKKSPASVVVDLLSGQVVSSELRISYHINTGVVDHSDIVPFRYIHTRYHPYDTHTHTRTFIIRDVD